jgi:hypothetical protein
MPSPREQVLDLVNDLVELQFPRQIFVYVLRDARRLISDVLSLLNTHNKSTPLAVTTCRRWGLH